MTPGPSRTPKRESGRTALLSLAGLLFKVNSPDAPLLPEPDHAYAEFLSPRSPAATEVPVHLSIGHPRVDTGFSKIFDSGESWSMHSRGPERLVAFSSPATPEMLLWAARFEVEPTSVEIACNPCLMVEGRGLVSPLRYPLDQILAMYALGARGILLHGGAAVFAQGACLFAGRSGAGKSTLATLIHRRTGIPVLSDDRVLACHRGPGVSIFGTPWPGEAGFARNSEAPASLILFLAKSAKISFRRLVPGKALERILPVTSIPWFDDAGPMEASLSFAGHLVRTVPCFEFSFPPSPEAADALARFLETLPG